MHIGTYAAKKVLRPLGVPDIQGERMPLTHVITFPIQFQTGARRGAMGEVELFTLFARPGVQFLHAVTNTTQAPCPPAAFLPGK